MSLFDFAKKKGKKAELPPKTVNVIPHTQVDAGRLAELALRSIQDGVIIINKDGFVKFINPAAVMMTGVEKAENALNLDFSLVMKLEFLDGTKVDAANNELLKAAKENTQFESKKYVIIGTLNDKKTPVRIVLTPTGGPGSDKIITFRDISKELEEEGAQAEFVSTASHEMRTPVASIEGYLSLALNPQTATIDSRARQYIESAHEASKRLGNLFKDLLDVTKLDDKRIRARMVPLELTSFVKKFADEYTPKFKEKNITYSFGVNKEESSRVGGASMRKIEQLVYCFVDTNFLSEILDNLIENAIKYTPIGGAIWVNVQGDGDRALINVTDTGIGIASDDLQHIFQKFYRADNSQTRTVGGTGLGLYLVKQRVEAMDGHVWAESSFGEGSTFFVSFPRLSEEDYERRLLAQKNQEAVQRFAEQSLTNSLSQSATPVLQEQQLPQQPLQQIPQQTPQQIPQQTAQQIPQQMLQQTPQQTAQQTPQQILQQIPQQMLQQIPQQTVQQTQQLQNAQNTQNQYFSYQNQYPTYQNQVQLNQSQQIQMQNGQNS